MAITEDQDRATDAETAFIGRKLGFSGRQRWLFLIFAAVCGAFSLFAGASWWFSFAAFLVLVSAASLVGERAPKTSSRASSSSGLVRRDLDGRSSHLIAALPDPCIVVNRRAVVVMHNAHAMSALPGLRIGDPLAFALRVPSLTEALRSVLAGGLGHILNFTDPVPLERTFEAHLTPVHINASAATEAPDYVVITLHDETKRQRLETMRVDFVANASHELRTPLASVLGFIETLQGSARNDPAARERFLAIMREQALRMARLIEDLLSLSQIELNAHVRPENIIDIAPILAQTKDALNPLAEENHTNLHLNIEGGPFLVRGERDEIYRIAENLIENAIKYGRTDGQVTIGVGREPAIDGFPPAILLTISDDGPGIAPEHLPRLTERFYRVDTASSRAKGGTGLGLAIVKHIVARHRARLAITSQLGKGSRFMIRFDEETSDKKV